MHRRAAWSTTIRLPTVTIRRIAYPHDRVSSIKRYGGYTPLRSPSRGGLEVTHHVTGRASWTATLASAMPRRALPCTPCYAQPCYAPACQPCHARPHGHVLQLSSDRPSDDTCRAPRRPSSPAVPSSLERPATRGQPARCATAGRGPRDWLSRGARQPVWTETGDRGARQPVWRSLPSSPAVPSSLERPARTPVLPSLR